MTIKIYLASRSPRRGELLRQLGVQYDALPADIDEDVLAGETPEHYVLRLAREKAEACMRMIAASGLPQRPILAADTTVCAEGEILGKPQDDADATAMLQRLSDRWHSVHTGIAVACNGSVETLISSTQVEFAPLSDHDIADYVASGEPHDKAGGYGIQGLGGAFVRRIEGSFTGVMGLPVYETAQLLERCGFRVLAR
jgi:septum formation protein